jgi:TPR repeat protein
MKFAALTLAVAVGLAFPAWAGFREGLEAYYALDYETALKEWAPAAEAGDRRAQYQIGVLFYRGDGVPRDYSEAAKWFRRAAERGDADAQFNLGLLYADGTGVPKDFVRAHMWFNLAAASYDAYRGEDWAIENRGWAARNRDWVAAQMSTAEIAKAERLARQWRTKP